MKHAERTYSVNRILSLSFCLAVLHSGPVSSSDNMKRVVIDRRRAEVTVSVIKRAGTILQAGRHLLVLKCDEKLMDEFNLLEDLPISESSSEANRRTRADLVQKFGNTGVERKVLVLDSSIDYTHPELSSSYSGGYDFVNIERDQSLIYPTDLSPEPSKGIRWEGGPSNGEFEHHI